MVALAALAAMEGIRKRSIAQRMTPSSSTSPLHIQQLSRLAVTLFWAHLQDFCTLALAPAGWRGQTCSFFAWDEAVSGWHISKHKKSVYTVFYPHALKQVGLPTPGCPRAPWD